MKKQIFKILIISIILSILALPASFLIVMFSDVANTKFISAADGSTGPAFDYFIKTFKSILLWIWIIYPLLHFSIRYIKKRLLA